MKITCKRQELSRGLSVVGHAVSTRTTLPVLGNLLLTAEGDHLRLAATNLDIAITCQIAARVEQEGVTTVPARLLTDFVNALEAGDVDLSPLPGGAQGLRVRAGSSEANIRGMDPTEFPVIPLVDGAAAFTLDAGELRGMISQTTFAAAADDARPIFTGVLTRLRDGKMTFASADTYRLAVRSTALAGFAGREDDLLIPARALNELSKIMPQDGAVDVLTTATQNQILFRMPGIEMVARLIEGQFPNFEAIVPKGATTRVVVMTDKLRAAAKVAALFAKSDSTSNTVRVTITPGNEGLTPGVVTLQATNDELGDSTGTVDATVDGPAVMILFNVKYLNDVLGVIDTPEIVLELNTPQSPGVVKPLGSEDYTYVIMPLYNRG